MYARATQGRTRIAGDVSSKPFQAVCQHPASRVKFSNDCMLCFRLLLRRDGVHGALRRERAIGDAL
jgi:hypothetical protein